MGRPRLPREVEDGFWGVVRAGEGVVRAAAVAAGVSFHTANGWFGKAGGIMPPVRELSGVRLSFTEREEIACLRAAGRGVREIARQVGRDPSTISRELHRVPAGRRGPYRASVAQADADVKAKRPKAAKLATNLVLRREVQARLERNHSPEQIARRLRADFPDTEEMWVSAETIYRSIYVQGRGGLRRELAKHLRTGRTQRKPRRRDGERRGRIPGMVNISQRPPEVADRAVPGHWEGDLIIGADSDSAIGTLVERTTGFVMLLHLPDNHGALAVQEAIIAKMADLPTILRQTLTWDQGSEMANHIQIAAATDLDIYFCDPHSPWQRGTNENTNGLLRQYFPKGTDVSVHGPGYLDFVAAELNNRPRKRLNWRTPAETLDHLLSEPFNPPGVATIG
ncbi:MAG: IS30 family transposase [Acidimicrobiia bacterium]